MLIYDTALPQLTEARERDVNRNRDRPNKISLETGLRQRVTIRVCTPHTSASIFQVAGSNVIHLQAADFWSNNLTRGGDTFVARWTGRDEATDAAVEDGDVLAAEDNEDTASAAAGAHFFSTDTAHHTSAEDRYNTASVTDVGGGRYEVTTASVAGSHWLELGVVEPGGVWGTYYEDGGVAYDGKQTRPLSVPPG